MAKGELQAYLVRLKEQVWRGKGGLRYRLPGRSKQWRPDAAPCCRIGQHVRRAAVPVRPAPSRLLSGSARKTARHKTLAQLVAEEGGGLAHDAARRGRRSMHARGALRARRGTRPMHTPHVTPLRARTPGARTPQLVEVINQDFGDYVGLASRLNSIDGSVVRMKQPLLDIKVAALG